MSAYIGDFAVGSVVSKNFNTHKADGTPIILAGSPVVKCLKGASLSIADGITLSVDYISITGLNNVSINTASQPAFFTAGADYTIIITTGTVDSISVVGSVIGSFSLANRPVQSVVSGVIPTAAQNAAAVADQQGGIVS